MAAVSTKLYVTERYVAWTLLTVSTSRSNLEIASFQIMESVYNSIALGLILYKTANGKGVLKVIAKQGLIYYMCVFSLCRFVYTEVLTRFLLLASTFPR